MFQLEDQGTSTLPHERRRVQPKSSSALVTGLAIAVSSASPPLASRDEDRILLLTMSVDADLPATIWHIVQRYTLLSETYGAQNSILNLERESSLRNARRVELLTLRLKRTLSAVEVQELAALQQSEEARFGARLREGNNKLRQLLES